MVDQSKSVTLGSTDNRSLHLKADVPHSRGVLVEPPSKLSHPGLVLPQRKNINVPGQVVLVVFPFQDVLANLFNLLGSLLVHASQTCSACSLPKERP